MRSKCHRAAISLLLIFLFFAASTPPLPAQPPDPLGGLALGAAFKVLGDKINEAIERATGAGLILEIQAGGQVALVLQQAQTTFEHEQKLFWTNLNIAQQNTISSVFSLANDFLSNTYQSVNAIEIRAQAIINGLPFAKDFPQAWNLSPAFSEAAGTIPVRFTMVGNFYDLPRKSYDAEIVVNGGKPVLNVQKDTASIAFEIPRSALKPASTSVGANPVLVRVPYRKTVFLFFKKKDYAEFRSTIGSLPVSMGTLTSTITTTGSGPVATETNVGPEDLQASDNDDIICGGEHADLAIHLAYPTSGWRVQPNTVSWILLWTQGDQGNDWYTPPRNCSTTLIACQCVSTRHKSWGTSGKVRFKISFTEERDTTVSTPVSSNVALGWGEIRTIDIPPVGATWSGSYQRFDGKRFDIPATGYQDDFISVKPTGPLQIVVRSAPYDKSFDLQKMKDAIKQREAIGPHP